MPNGDFYHGEFQFNKMHGQGVYKILSTGMCLSGTWEKGVQNGTFTATTVDAKGAKKIVPVEYVNGARSG